jgi:predicted transcriptional regulator
MERAVSNDTRQFMIMAIVTIHNNMDMIDPETIASLSMMDDEDLIYEVGETAITLSKYAAETASNAKKLLDNATVITDGSI